MSSSNLPHWIKGPLRLIIALVVRVVRPAVLHRLPHRLRSRSLLAFDRLLQIHPIEFRRASTRYGFKVSGNTKDLIQRCAYLYGVWEPTLSRWITEHLRPGDIAVDVGANIGYFTLLASRLVGPEGLVIAFEPEPTIANRLRDNLAENHSANVQLYELVVSDRTGKAAIFRARESNLGASATQGQEGDPATDVAMARGDDVISPELWPRIRLVKVDVEGDEFNVLSGMRSMLAALPAGACVVAEIAPERLAKRGVTTREALALMERLGYSTYTVDNGYSPDYYAYERHIPPQPLTDDPADQVDVLFIKAG